MNFSASMSSLSHSMTCRLSIAAGSIGTSSSSRSCVSTKPPGCCERWRGVPISCARQLERQPQPAVAEIEVELLAASRSATPSSLQPQIMRGKRAR